MAGQGSESRRAQADETTLPRGERGRVVIAREREFPDVKAICRLLGHQWGKGRWSGSAVCSRCGAVTTNRAMAQEAFDRARAEKPWKRGERT